MLLTVTFPAEPFNAAVRNGAAGAVIQRILEESKPEVADFTEQERPFPVTRAGRRGGRKLGKRSMTR